MKRAASLMILGASLTWSQFSLAAQPDPELQLRAIRQALVEASLEKTTKVNASAWVDEHGRLHESAHFQTDARIKGVRVLSYTEDGTDSPKVKIDLESLPWSIRVAQANRGESCEPAPQNWRQPLLIQSQLLEGFSGPEMYLSKALLKESQKAWQDVALRSGRWSIDSPPLLAKDSYHQAWMGQGEEPLGWQIWVELSPSAPQVSQTGWFNPGRLKALFSSEPSKSWTLRVVFGQKSTPNAPIQVHWSNELTIDVPLSALSRQPDRWIQQMMPQIVDNFTQWLTPEGQQASCDPVKFSVSAQAGNRWTLQAGLGNGIKVGDRVLVVNASKLPGRLLEPGSSQQMGLAEVTRVGKRQSELKPVAGTVQPVAGDWVALPL